MKPSHSPNVGHGTSCSQKRPIIMQTKFLFSTNSDSSKLSHRDKPKHAVKDYGVTVVIFHIGISLLSLGGFYLAVIRHLLPTFQIFLTERVCVLNIRVNG
jgi:hypothetical protein